MVRGVPGSSTTSALAAPMSRASKQSGSARGWTEHWHALGTSADFGGALTALTETFVGKGSLAQIRSADAWTGPMMFRQFQLEHGAIVPVRVRNTPDWRTVSPVARRAFASANEHAIADGTAVLPEALWASYSAPALVPPSWVSSLAEHEALVRTTCAGCHAEAAGGFHVDPLANGSQAPALSRFLADPTKEVDELRRRIEVMQLTLTRPE